MSEERQEAVPIRLLVAVTACWFLGQMGYYAQAQLFGPVMARYGLDEAAAGVVMTQEATAYAVMAIIMAGPVTRIPRAYIALAGGVIAFFSNLAAGFSENFDVLSAARLTAGIGAGMIGAAGTAAAASSVNPQRVFAIVSVSWGLMSSVSAIVLPYFTVPFGAMGGYLAMAGAIALFLPLTLWLPPPPRDLQEEAATREQMHRLSALSRLTERLGIRGAANGRFAIVALVALFVYEAGQGAVQVFLEQFGFRAGMEEYGIGQVLGIASFVGLSGGVAAAWLANRYGNLRPALVGIATNTVVAAMLVLGETPLAFAGLYLAWNACFYFVVPYILGIMSEMDPKGRWAVATDAVWWLGAAPGPAIGGYIVTQAGYGGLAVMPIVVGSISILLFYFTLTRFYATRPAHRPA